MSRTKEKELPNALFFQRILAFFIDVTIIAWVCSIFVTPFLNEKAITKLSNQSNEVFQKYSDKKIDMKTYFSQSMDLSYEIAKQNGLYTIVELIVSLLYFVLFPVYYNGQTLGKRLMRIKIVNVENRDLTINEMIYRASIINFLLVDFLLLCIILFCKKDLYSILAFIVEAIQYVVVLASIFMVIYRKDGRGVHDLIANTRVVRVDGIKELKTCEN